MSEASRVFGALNIPLPGAATMENEASDEGSEPLGPIEREAEGAVESGSGGSQIWSNFYSPPQPQASYGAFLSFSDTPE
ncbi:hypothetical protein FRC10_002064 [Ceratobasidium sp. 414]|nr:hypothetical protein FRC10_002064 [Ceratobasidium sp. 414]